MYDVTSLLFDHIFLSYIDVFKPRKKLYLVAESNQQRALIVHGDLDHLVECIYGIFDIYHAHDVGPKLFVQLLDSKMDVLRLQFMIPQAQKQNRGSLTHHEVRRNIGHLISHVFDVLQNRVALLYRLDQEIGRLIRICLGRLRIGSGRAEDLGVFGVIGLRSILGIGVFVGRRLVYNLDWVVVATLRLVTVGKPLGI